MITVDIQFLSQFYCPNFFCSSVIAHLSDRFRCRHSNDEFPMEKTAYNNVYLKHPINVILLEKSHQIKYELYIYKRFNRKQLFGKLTILKPSHDVKIFTRSFCSLNLAFEILFTQLLDGQRLRRDFFGFQNQLNSTLDWKLFVFQMVYYLFDLGLSH